MTTRGLREMAKSIVHRARRSSIRPGCVVKVVAHDGIYSGCCGTVEYLARSNSGNAYAYVVFGSRAFGIAKARTRSFRLTRGLSGDVSWVKSKQMFMVKELVPLTAARSWDSEAI
jgi:hypothetical protein